MIFSPFERMVGFRYLRARRQEGFISVISWFSLIGIGLGVATLIIVMGVMNGFREELFSRVLGLNGHLNIYASYGVLENYQPILDKVSGTRNVLEVSPTVEGQALITKNGAASGAFVRGVLPELFRNRKTVSNHIVDGSLENFSDDKIAIGIRMAQRLGLHVGDSLTLISPSSNSTVFGSAPRMRAYSIAAVFDVGMYEYDNNFVFMPLAEAQIFFRTGAAISSLELFVADPQDLGSIKADLISVLRGDPVRLMDWQQTNSSFFTALQVERNVMFLILTLIIVVAAFNIISGLIMLVKDKGKDIAILRTMGATRGMVMRIFFLGGASVGVLGTLFGLGLGLLIATNIENVRQIVQAVTGTEVFSPEVYFLTHMPCKIDWHEVVSVVLMALSLSFLATLYPSWRAAKLDPVEALRYE
jgi:lipoprotein-releasing system permease protein